MFNLTRQERQVILFLLGVAWVGLGISYAMKLSPAVEKSINADKSISKLNLNKVTAQDFLGIKCVNSKLAQKIIEYRDDNGEFSSLEDLKEVKGIGEYRYGKLKEYFYVE